MACPQVRLNSVFWSLSNQTPVFNEWMPRLI